MKFSIAKSGWRTHRARGRQWAGPGGDAHCTQPGIGPGARQFQVILPGFVPQPLFERAHKTLGNAVGLGPVACDEDMDEFCLPIKLKGRRPKVDAPVRNQEEQFRREQTSRASTIISAVTLGPATKSGKPRHWHVQLSVRTRMAIQAITIGNWDHCCRKARRCCCQAQSTSFLCATSSWRWRRKMRQGSSWAVRAGGAVSAAVLVGA